MIKDYTNNSTLDQIEIRLESIESMLKQIHQEQASTPNHLLTSKEAAQALQITTRHLQNLRDRGEIGFVQHGRTVRYKSESIQAFIDAHYLYPKTQTGGQDEVN